MAKANNPYTTSGKAARSLSVRYGDKGPLSFNNVVKNKFISLLTARGVLSLLAYVSFTKLTFSLLVEELSPEETKAILIRYLPNHTWLL